ncbi:hypothetical protein GVAV_000348 [Gurleya vavrai]
MSEIENKIKNCTTVKEDFSKMNIDDVRNVCNDKLKRENDFKRNNEITEKNKITSKNYLIKMKDLENNRSKNQEPNTKNDDTKFRYLNTANNQQVNHFIEKNSQLNKELPTTYQKKTEHYNEKKNDEIKNINITNSFLFIEKDIKEKIGSQKFFKNSMDILKPMKNEIGSKNNTSNISLKNPKREIRNSQNLVSKYDKDIFDCYKNYNDSSSDIINSYLRDHNFGNNTHDSKEDLNIDSDNISYTNKDKKILNNNNSNRKKFEQNNSSEDSLNYKKNELKSSNNFQEISNDDSHMKENIKNDVKKKDFISNSDISREIKNEIKHNDLDNSTEENNLSSENANFDSQNVEASTKDDNQIENFFTGDCRDSTEIDSSLSINSILEEYRNTDQIGMDFFEINRNISLRMIEYMSSNKKHT